VIDYKHTLMKQKNISEPDAFREIQRQSMDRRKSMKDVADAVILSDEIRQAK
jgi:AmiR/NasT family two-component response regulator